MPKKKLTPEEKKALRAQRKAEKKRLAELKRRQLRHDHLSREIHFGELTIKQHEKKWRKMLLRISLPKLREDLQFAWHNFERVIDSKDFTISLLLDEIDAAEEQYMMNLRCHSENIDSLIAKFGDQLNELKLYSEGQIEAMKAFADQETEEITHHAADSEDYLKTMLYGLEISKKEQEKFVRGEYLSKFDEETNRCAHIIQVLRAGLESTFSKIWENINHFLKTYYIQTKEKRKAYAVLSQQDRNLQEICTKQHIKLNNMIETVKKLRNKLNLLVESEQQKISDLCQESQYFADAFWTLRIRLAADRSLDANSLQILTVESNQAADHLEKIAKKGERLLQLAAICRKLETQEEKILPFPLRFLDDVKSTSNSIDVDDFNTTSDLYLFWQRVGQADASRHGINEEREFLKRENKTLKLKIHNYCQCLECPFESPNNKN